MDDSSQPPPDLADATPEATAKTHWQAKVRQTLYTHPEFKYAERGVWGLA